MTIIDDYKKLEVRILSVAERFNTRTKEIEQIETSVKDILKDIEKNGFESLKKFTSRFDKKDFTNPEDFIIPCKGAFKKLSDEQKKAVEIAAQRIKKFQEACLPKKYELIEKDDSIQVKFNPIESVGVYVPGGAAPLVSTVLMTVIPAQVAGVKDIKIVSPPTVHPYITAVADYLGIEKIFQMGGAQAVGALAFGIEELGLEQVDKIVGPGNFYVTFAKKEVFGKVGIDALYGPSELVIVADDSAKPKSIAHDLMSQLEHGSGLEAACLLTNSHALAEQVLRLLKEMIEEQPRKNAIKKAWENYGIIGVLNNLSDCVKFSNLFAPEHLELKIKDAKSLVSEVKNAGAVFLNRTNEAMGDYLAGPSHCLPTGRSARYSSGLSVWDFLKRTSVVDITVTDELRSHTALLARMEGLEAHAQAAENV